VRWSTRARDALLAGIVSSQAYVEVTLCLLSTYKALWFRAQSQSPHWWRTCSIRNYPTDSRSMFTLKSLLIPCLLSVTTYAQNISIASPTSAQTMTVGQPMNVELDFGNQLTGVKHVSVVIALQDCTGLPCPSVSPQDDMGNVLFAGNYTPQEHEQNKPPYQNFSITLPVGTHGGTNVLNVAHFMLVGASSTPVLEFRNVSINTQNASSASSAAKSSAQQ